MTTMQDIDLERKKEHDSVQVAAREDSSFEPAPVKGGQPVNIQEDAFLVTDTENHIDYRSMGWVVAAILVTAENIALGLLSFPSTMNRLGMVGGIIATIGCGALAYWSGWVMVNFKVRNPGVMNFANAMYILWGKGGSRVIAAGMVLKSIGLGGSHVLTGKIAIASFTTSTCTVWWAFLIAVVSILMSMPRRFHDLTLLSCLSVFSIITAGFITIVGTGIQDPADIMKNNVPIVWRAFPANPNVQDVFGGLSNVIFGYGGNMAVFSFASEMKKPADFKKSFALSQTLITIVYLLVGCIVYSFTGQYVTSPALNSLAHTTRIVAYAFALVCILISGVVGVYVGAKVLHVGIYRNSESLTARTLKARLHWLSIIIFMWAAGFTLAELIPFFNQLLTIVSSLFTVWFAYGLPAMIWLYMHDVTLFKLRNIVPASRGWANKFNLACVVVAIALSAATTPLGLYSAIKGIIQGYSNGTFSRPFQC